MAGLRVEIAPALLGWALRRSGADQDQLETKFPKLREWEAGESSPTFKQLEKFAAATHTPLGSFFLSEPPAESLPLPDFRTLGEQQIDEPSADLIDAIGIVERRQEWFAQFARYIDREPLDFIGTLTLHTDEADAAKAIAERLRFRPQDRRDLSSWEEALRSLIEHAEDAGILVMVSGIVGSNTHRVLDTREFRGFAIADALAPVIFVNGADAKSAQNFTVAHELAHLWLGMSGVSNVGPRTRDLAPIERWCNRVAAELLVPTDLITDEYDAKAAPEDEAVRLARIFKVSPEVILRRALEAKLIGWDAYELALAEEESRQRAASGASGGNFYYTLPVRTSKTFARAVIADALEGRTLYRDAYRLLGLTKAETFDRLTRELGVR